MKRITTVKRRPTRPYRSELRDERADDTRRRILDALIRTLARGPARLSIPAVASEAGVSIPTVYRYFKTKAALVTALGPYLHERTRLMEVPDLSQGAGGMVREVYARHAALAPELRAALASDVGGELRRRSMGRRVALIRGALEALAPDASADDLARLTNVVLILGATPTIRAFEEYLGLQPARAAEDVGWAVDTLVRSLQRKRA